VSSQRQETQLAVIAESAEALTELQAGLTLAQEEVCEPSPRHRSVSTFISSRDQHRSLSISIIIIFTIPLSSSPSLYHPPPSGLGLSGHCITVERGGGAAVEAKGEIGSGSGNLCHANPRPRHLLRGTTQKKEEEWWCLCYNYREWVVACSDRQHACLFPHDHHSKASETQEIASRALRLQIEKLSSQLKSKDDEVSKEKNRT
jgi:hypothetical protein